LILLGARGQKLEKTGFGVELGLSRCSNSSNHFSQQEPTLITIKIGTPDGQHRFSPDALTLETGKLYKLRLENAGVQAYYFSSPSLVDAVYTRKVVVRDADEKVITEIYGPVRRFEIATGKSIEWWILPVRTGVFDDVISTKKLALDGMKATITVK
jgi:hypothetical protein